MPLDAICLQGVVAELTPQVIGSRIEKIQQPARDTVLLHLRSKGKLLLSANGSRYTDATANSPVGARLAALRRANLERSTPAALGGCPAAVNA